MEESPVEYVTPAKILTGRAKEVTVADLRKTIEILQLNSDEKDKLPRKKDELIMFLLGKMVNQDLIPEQLPVEEYLTSVKVLSGLEKEVKVADLKKTISSLDLKDKGDEVPTRKADLVEYLQDKLEEKSIAPEEISKSRGRSSARVTSPSRRSSARVTSPSRRSSATTTEEKKSPLFTKKKIASFIVASLLSYYYLRAKGYLDNPSGVIQDIVYSNASTVSSMASEVVFDVARTVPFLTTGAWVSTDKHKTMPDFLEPYRPVPSSKGTTTYPLGYWGGKEPYKQEYRLGWPSQNQ